MDKEEMKRLTAGQSVISEKIRILHDAGAERAEIAAFLERRYQQVHNVLKRSNRLDLPNRIELGNRRGVSSSGNHKIHQVRVEARGAIRLPASFLKERGVAEGEMLICREEDDSLRIMTRAAALEALRKTARQQMPDEAALLDALIGSQSKNPQG